MNPKFSAGQTTYFLDDPEPGRVMRTEHRDDGHWYQIAFADQPDDWDGYWYAERMLYAKPLGSNYEDHPADNQSVETQACSTSDHGQPN